MADYQLVFLPGVQDPVRFDDNLADADVKRALQDILARPSNKPRVRIYDPQSDTLITK